jgi:hypothetical protein
MKRSVRWLSVLAILAAFTVWLEPTRVAWGRLRGEAFYEGRPTSYWRAEIARWRRATIHASGLSMHIRYSREEHWLETRWHSLTQRPEPSWPRILDGDAAAEAVLHALANDPADNVRELVAEGLQRIATGDRGPTRTVHFDWNELETVLGLIRK